MVDPVGYRFRPTDEEIVVHYVRPKNIESNTSHVDEVMNTVDIYSFDPWELRFKSRIKSRDEVVWYFFGCKKRMRNNRQRRTIPSGFWSNTGETKPIIRKKGGGGDHEKIGEKRVFSKSKSKSKSDWVMHEYVATFSSPDSQRMTTSTYTVCKVMFKGDPTDLPSSSSLIPQLNSNSSGGLSTESEVQNPNQITSSITSSISSIPHVNNNNSGVLSTETEVDPRLFSGFLYLEEDAHFEDETLRDLNSLPNNDDAEEEEWLVNLWSMQGDRNDHRPKMPLTGFISDDDDDDDSDSDSISTKTVPPHKKLKVLFHMIWQCSIKSSSTCVTFGNSNRLIDQIIDLPESPRSTIESVSLTQEVSKALGANSAISEKKMSPCDDDAQVSEIGGDQMGQEMVIKNKRAGFIYRMIQKFAKKIKLCSCVSRI
ncbi:BnaC05g01000D [Brassica napus]|uniref:BnaC05g01000D protein n=1 Tax=Brassica napus TaxID=3708 RepID=A0A078FQ06_BRANA|nr:BnaC05g01000D [Brassica napus]